MTNKLKVILYGILSMLLFLLVARIVSEAAIFIMPDNALDSGNSVSVAREITSVYYYGRIYLIEYFLNHAFIEELFFRFLPIIFLAQWRYCGGKVVCDSSSFRTRLVVGVASIIFGWLHGGFWNIFVQGVYGVAFAAVFIFAANKAPVRFGRVTRSVIGLYAATLIHAFSNYALVSAALN